MSEVKLSVPFTKFSVQLIGEDSPRTIESQGCIFDAESGSYQFVVEDADGDFCVYTRLSAGIVHSIIDPRFTKDAVLKDLYTAQYAKEMEAAKNAKQ